MRHRHRRVLALPLLLAAGCAAPADPAATPTAVARVGGPDRGKMPRNCRAAALDSPIMAQRLMAATFAEGPNGLEAPVFACGKPAFRPL